MKTLVRNTVSLYLLEDDVVVTVTETDITVGQPPKFIIADCNASNTTLFAGVTAPDDWVGGKYFFDGTTWTLDPNWVDPEQLLDI